MSRGGTAAATPFTPAPRVCPPTFPTADIVLLAPPQPPPARAGMAARALPAAMAVATLLLTAVLLRSGASSVRSPTFLLFPITMLASTCAAAAAGRGRSRGRVIDADRGEYLRYLADLRRQVTDTAAAQQFSLMWCHPDPATLWTLIGGPRMWERRRGDSDFGHARIGVATQRLATRLVAPQTGPADRLDPVTAAALRRFIHTHATIRDAPIAVAVTELAVITVAGDRGPVRALLAALLCQLAVLHDPHRIRIAAALSARTAKHWEWLKWLPHHHHPDTGEPLVYPSLAALAPDLSVLRGGRAPHLVVLVDGDGEPRWRTGPAGVTVCEVGTGCDSAAGLRLRVSAAGLAVRHGDADEVLAAPDQLSVPEALVCARALAAYRCAPTTGPPGWPQLLSIDDPAALDPQLCWRRGGRGQQLRVPIGVTAAGVPVELDIKEAADGGIGPHGLCIGATGSGKSEFLRTVVVSMMVRHSPEVLNLVLVDFKGGATFGGMARARHVAALITNLADEAPLVARMRDALTGELTRRQELLRAAGDLVDLAAYQSARRDGAPLPALATLFVIVDEFSELLCQHPDFVEVFVAIGRLGRSLGVHLLLASQRLDEGRLRGLESHLSYRVCLKTLSAAESRMVLGVPDAHQLPNIPGVGYLRCGTEELIRFQTAFVSGPCPAPRGAPPGAPAVRRFTAHPLAPADADRRPTAGQPSVLDTVLGRLAGHGPSAHEVWLPPLGPAPTLDALLGQPGSGGLAVPIGIVDRPFEQRRTPMTVDFGGAAGNMAVVGAPQSGKSTALRTVITALAATHDPGRVQFYCLDFGGGALAAVRAMPHVGAVAPRADRDLVERTVAELASIVAAREALFAEQQIDSMDRYRGLRADTDPVCAADRFADVFLVIDGWAGVRQEFAALEEPITALAGRGLSVGVHVVLSASRWGEIRPALKDQIGTRLELRLGDPADSEHPRGRAQQVPADRPGRGLSGDGLHLLIALPRLGGGDVAALLRERHGTHAAPPIPRLPAHLDAHTVIATAGTAATAHPLLGVEGRALRAVAVDFAQHPHLLILGDNECGKTATLRQLCRELVRTRTAAQAQLVIVDVRRGLLGAVQTKHLAGYLISAAAVETRLPELLGLLTDRMPPADVTQRQLRERSWWSGPEHYLVVDDYDLVATAARNPLSPLLEFLPHAKDLGLHLIVARRSGGAARALFEPLLAGLREVGATALTMSADPDDGPLLGPRRPAPLPPGRGVLRTRRGEEQAVQVAWSPP